MFVTGNIINASIVIQWIIFIDSPAIRLVKILCREFDETFQHMFSNTVRNKDVEYK